MAHTVKLTDDQAVQDQIYPVEVKVYDAGEQIVPSSATITINDPDGTAVVAAAAMSIDGSGTLTYSLAAASTETLWEKATIAITYVYAGVTYRAVKFFDCVIVAIYCTVIDLDLKGYEPNLAAGKWSTQTNFDDQIQKAFEEVKQAIKNLGRRPHMLLDGGQVREPVIFKALEIIFRSWIKAPDDVFRFKTDLYAELYKTAFASLQIAYDEDESGDISDDETAGLGDKWMER